MKKKKCPVCAIKNGKRLCKINGSSLICPSCCAQIRNPDCEGCDYYAQAARYEKEKLMKPKSETFVMRIDPEVDEAVDQALAMVERGQIREGERVISKLLKTHPDIHTVQFAMGVICAMEGRFNEAITYFDKAILIYPYFVEAWFNKGTAHQENLDIKETIRAFQKVIKIGDPADDLVHKARNFIEGMEKQLHEESGMTIDAYLKSMDVFNEAFAAMQNSEWENALTGFQDVVMKDPKHTQSYGNMGICYGYLGQRDKALSAFDKALELDPNYEPALQNRKIFVSLEEGEKFSDLRFKSVEYYRDSSSKKKSLLGSFFR